MSHEEHRLLITLALIVSELNPGRKAEIEADLDAMRAAVIGPERQDYTLRRALERIRDSHVPDQPTDSAGDDTVWIMQHVSHLRRIAAEALKDAP